MAKLKLIFIATSEKLPYVDPRTGRIKLNACKGCGAPLRDPISKERGYGRKCWSKVEKMIILEIPNGGEK